MELVFLVLPIALALAGVAVLAFVWSARSGQLDDLETPAHRILFDDAEDRAVPDDAEAPPEGDEPPREGDGTQAQEGATSRSPG